MYLVQSAFSSEVTLEPSKHIHQQYDNCHLSLTKPKKAERVETVVPLSQMGKLRLKRSG